MKHLMSYETPRDPRRWDMVIAALLALILIVLIAMWLSVGFSTPTKLEPTFGEVGPAILCLEGKIEFCEGTGLMGR